MVFNNINRDLIRVYEFINNRLYFNFNNLMSNETLFYI